MMKRFLSLMLLVHFSAPEKVILSNDFGRTGLTEDWIRYNDKCVGTQIWFFDTNNVNHPKYGVCFSSNCFLETAPYNIKSVNTVYADAKFIGRFCDALIQPLKNCGENISVNAIIVDSFPSNKHVPNTPTETVVEFPIIDSLKKPGYDKNGKPTGFFEAMQTISFDNKHDKRYIRYLFDSKMACGSITGFEVYYYKCPFATSSLTEFGDINAPSFSEKEKDCKGKCVDNAVNVGNEKLIMKCLWNGTVALTTGKCVCLQGYEKEQNGCKSKYIYQKIINLCFPLLRKKLLLNKGNNLHGKLFPGCKGMKLTF